MIKFYKNRFIYFSISAVIFIIGIIFTFVNGINLDIAFTGGSIIKYEYTGEINVGDAEKVVTDSINRLSRGQTTTDILTGAKKFVINLADKEGLSAQNQDILDDALKAAFPDANLNLSESNIVEPFIGKQFFSKSMTAIIIAFILMVLYVWYSFRKIGGLSAGTMGLIALMHDVLVVFAAFIIFKIPIDENFVAVTLTIIGYSINDTIVIYDRIRENKQISRVKISTEDLVDKSINQSLSRSINTSVTTFISIAIIYTFAALSGITSVSNFALPLMFGILSGCYSSVCIAGPLWVSWINFKNRKSQPAKS